MPGHERRVGLMTLLPIDRVAAESRARTPLEARHQPPGRWLDRAVGALIGIVVLVVLVLIYVML